MSPGSSTLKSPIKGFYTLASVAYGCLEDIGEDESMFSRFLHWAHDGMRELAFDQSHEVLTKVIRMKSWKQIEWPEDMVDWTKIGFKDGDEIRVLIQDSNIPKYFDRAQNELKQNKPIRPIYDLDISAAPRVPFIGGMFEDRVYGYAVGFNGAGYFDVDRKNRVINFRSTIEGDQDVYLEYITDGINYSGHTVIHPYTYNMLKAFVHWQRKLHNDKYSVMERRDAERIYNNMRSDVSVRNLNIGIATIREILRSGYTQVPQN